MAVHSFDSAPNPRADAAMRLHSAAEIVPNANGTSTMVYDAG